MIEQVLRASVEFLWTYAEECLYTDNHFNKLFNIYKPNVTWNIFSGKILKLGIEKNNCAHAVQQTWLGLVVMVWDL